jgi:hypothetical protein
MQKCGLLVTLQQLDMKVAKFTQTIPIHYFEMVYQEHLAVFGSSIDTLIWVFDKQQRLNLWSPSFD